MTYGKACRSLTQFVNLSHRACVFLVAFFRFPLAQHSCSFAAHLARRAAAISKLQEAQVEARIGTGTPQPPQRVRNVPFKSEHEKY